jgi:hypothetical protein
MPGTDLLEALAQLPREHGTTAGVLVAWLPAWSFGRQHDPQTGHRELHIAFGATMAPLGSLSAAIRAGVLAMAARGRLVQSLQDLDDAGGGERRAARERRRRDGKGEILQTFLAYRLADAPEKMALGIAIGDPLTLRHEPANLWDANAVKVYWREQWIGYIPKDMARLLVEEVSDLAAGLGALVSGLSTTTLRDAFRLQIAIPIERASRRLRALGVNSSFAWDFDRTSGPDKLRLVVSASETAFRELQELLASGFDVSKCGYSYYPTQDGRHYPWYLSVTDAQGRAPQDPEAVERLIRSHFGVVSESTRRRERGERLADLETKQEEIGRRLTTIRAEEGRLRRELTTSRAQLEKRSERVRDQKQQARAKAEALEQDLLIAQQELDLALNENAALALDRDQLTTTIERQQEELTYFHELSEAGGFALGQPSGSWRDAAAANDEEDDLNGRLLATLQAQAAGQRPRQILELIEELCPGSLVVLDSAWKSADAAAGFERGDRLFALLWKLATAYRQARLAGQSDHVGIEVFGPKGFAARESAGVEANANAMRWRLFSYRGQEVPMLQHLKIGVKDSVNRTLRLHFHWDGDSGQVVIGHCGAHLPVPGH